MPQRLPLCALLAGSLLFAQSPDRNSPNSPYYFALNPPPSSHARTLKATLPPSLRTAVSQALIEENPGALGHYLLKLAAGNARLQRAFWNAQQNTRPDLQCGSSAGSAGTTTGTVGAGIAPVLCSAFESVGAVETVQGNVVTIRANAENFARALAGQDAGIPAGKTYLSKIEVFGTFETNQPGMQTVDVSHAATPAVVQQAKFIPDPRTFTSAGVRWNPYNDHDNAGSGMARKTSKRTREIVLASRLPDLMTADPDFQAGFFAALQTAFSRVTSSPEYQSLRADLLLQAASRDSAREAARPFTAADQDAETSAALDQVALAALRADPDLGKHIFEAARDASRSKLGDLTEVGHAISADYVYNRPYNQAVTHTFRLVADWKPKDSLGLYTGNFAVDLFGGDGQTGQLRDLQASGSVKRELGNNANFVLSGYFQYQKANALLHLSSANLAPGTEIQLNGSAETLLAPKGKIGVFQVLFNITSGTEKARTVVPIGFTYSNRTDLLHGNEFRGHVGLHFDPSTLFGKN